MDENRCLLDVINNPQLLQSFLESESNNTDNRTPSSNAESSPQSSTATTLPQTNSIQETVTDFVDSDKIEAISIVNDPQNAQAIPKNDITISTNIKNSPSISEMQTDIIDPTITNIDGVPPPIPQSLPLPIQVETMPSAIALQPSPTQTPSFCPIPITTQSLDSTPMTTSVYTTVANQILEPTTSPISLEPTNTGILPSMSHSFSPNESPTFTPNTSSTFEPATSPVLSLHASSDISNSKIQSLDQTSCSPTTSAITPTTDSSCTMEPSLNTLTSPLFSASTQSSSPAPLQEPSTLAPTSYSNTISETASPATTEPNSMMTYNTTQNFTPTPSATLPSTLAPILAQAPDQAITTMASPVTDLTPSPNSIIAPVASLGLASTPTSSSMTPSPGVAVTTGSTIALTPQPAVTPNSNSTPVPITNHSMVTSAATTTSTTPTIPTTPTTLTKPTTTTTKPAPKRAPRRSTPKTTKAKNVKNSTPTTPAPPISQMQPQHSQPHPLPPTGPQTSMQGSYVSNPAQPQIFLQSTNSGIRQPTILAQQQRVIQIQTANGPMYFAIAPGPTMNNSNMMHNNMNQQQTIYVAGQQNSQQNIVLPPSQPMMMPRVPNQLILNRPISNSGQLMPSQQQFIQIQTPNGPMLLALPTQPAPQTINNPMIDYDNQVQHQQQHQQHHHQHQQQAPIQHVQTKYVSNSKQSGLDLDDLLLDCGILPEERMSTSISPGTNKISHSPSIQPTSSPMPSMTQMNPTIQPLVNQPSPIPNNPTQQPLPNYSGQPIRQQPIRITIGPDGQMIMQPTVYGSIRPVVATGPMGPTHLNMTNTIMPSNPQMVAMTMSPPTQQTSEIKAENNGKKQPAKGKETTAKRSRSKKSDIDKFPTLKTPKLQEQQQKQKQLQAVTVVPMTVLVGDQNKTAVLAGSDVRSNVAQLPSGQVSLAKIVTTPVIQSGPLHPSANSNVIPTSAAQATIGQIDQGQNNSSNQNTQLAVQGAELNFQNNVVPISQVMGTTVVANNSSVPQTSSSGNVTTNLLHRAHNFAGTVESNPHISSSLMPTLSLTVDAPKIEQNGLVATRDGQIQSATIQGVQSNGGPITATFVFNHQAQLTANQPNSQDQQHLINNQTQQVTRQTDLRVQSILNQLKADQNAASNPQTKQSFQSFEDACKRLLRYHVFNSRGVEDSQIKKCKYQSPKFKHCIKANVKEPNPLTYYCHDTVDEIFEAAAESLIKRKNIIYDKYRILALKNSMVSKRVTLHASKTLLYVMDSS